MASKKYWEHKSLKEMSPEEWEGLCDGCAKCCLLKLIDDDTEELFYTDVACRQLDLKTCRCKDYSNRHYFVSGCVSLRPDNLEALTWLPSTCAYRLVFEGKPLPEWHPLIAGNTHMIHETQNSIMDKVVPEKTVSEEELEDHIIDWVDNKMSESKT